MGSILLYAYIAASYVSFIQHENMQELYIISSSEYAPEDIFSNGICHYQIIKLVT